MEYIKHNSLARESAYSLNGGYGDSRRISEEIHLKDMPRVLDLNGQEVHSIHSSLIDASSDSGYHNGVRESRRMSEVSQLSAGGGGSTGFTNGGFTAISGYPHGRRMSDAGHLEGRRYSHLQVPTHLYGARSHEDLLGHIETSSMSGHAQRASGARRQSALNAARRMSTLEMKRKHELMGDENARSGSMSLDRRISLVSTNSAAPLLSAINHTARAFGEITVMPIGDQHAHSPHAEVVLEESVAYNSSSQGLMLDAAESQYSAESYEAQQQGYDNHHAYLVGQGDPYGSQHFSGADSYGMYGSYKQS
ncbi:uncharacterized protein LOC106173750 [Lingula anatina]|uniref:Uncharacterized protein LOC106173750 n=1 Tax=Lingula anatina TaxID=7574 RepID=A0A1S3JJ46_LINAN|nr:uncharacterized protein LOC106173750 [Lingula anatina]|eukprot:XP_013410435.1 uncharacterized protein LOC106173750 [Lingula anatina]